MVSFLSVSIPASSIADSKVCSSPSDVLNFVPGFAPFAFSSLTFCANSLPSYANGSLLNSAPSTISSASSLLVTIDGIDQKPSTNYSTSGATITFTSAPATSAEIEVRDLGIKTSVRRGTGFLLDTLTVSGSSTTTMTLSHEVPVNDVFIFINGVCQIPTSAYSVSGTTVTFAYALSDGDVVVARYQR